MADVQFDKRFAPAEATRGSWVPIDSSTISNYPTGDGEGVSRGRYAQLNYIVGSEPGSLSLALSGGNVILPVSSVHIDEPIRIENEPGQDFVVTINHTVSTLETRPNTTDYQSVSVQAASVETISFSPNVLTVEVFNNSPDLPAYIHFSSTDLATVSAQGLPVFAESFYSVDRETTTMYVGNADASNGVDVRIVGHYRSS